MGKYPIVNKRFELIEYIYYLQYQANIDNIMVETTDACFMVWESSSFTVNGEETSSKEFYEILDRCKGPIMCNDMEFKKKDTEYISCEVIEIEGIVSSIISF